MRRNQHNRAVSRSGIVSCMKRDRDFIACVHNVTDIYDPIIDRKLTVYAITRMLGYLLHCYMSLILSDIK